MTIMNHPATERTAPAAPTATTLRLDAASMAIKQATGVDREIRTTTKYDEQDRPTLHIAVEEHRVLASGREELARLIAEEIGADLVIGVRSGVLAATAWLEQADGSVISLYARLDDEGAAR